MWEQGQQRATVWLFCAERHDEYQRRAEYKITWLRVASVQCAVEKVQKTRSASPEKTREEHSRATTEEFDQFAMNRYKGSRKAAKVNAAAAIEEDDGLDVEREALPARCRRHAICEEMERYSLNDAGVSLRGYSKLLVTRRLLFETRLL